VVFAFGSVIVCGKPIPSFFLLAPGFWLLDSRFFNFPAPISKRVNWCGEHGCLRLMSGIDRDAYIGRPAFKYLPGGFQNVVRESDQVVHDEKP